MSVSQAIGHVLVAGGLTGCVQIGGVIYEVQMRFSDAVQLEDGTWSEIDLAMNDDEKACMATTCGDAKTDEATYTGCFKDKCREKRGSTPSKAGTETEK